MKARFSNAAGRMLKKGLDDLILVRLRNRRARSFVFHPLCQALQNGGFQITSLRRYCIGSFQNKLMDHLLLSTHSNHGRQPLHQGRIGRIVVAVIIQDNF